MLQALCVLSGLPQDGHIKSVVASRSGAGVELVVQGEGLLKPRVFPFLNGKMRVLEFNAGMDGKGGKTTVGYGGVQSFNTFWYSANPPKVRVNVRMEKSTEPVFTQVPDGWRISFNAPVQPQPQMVAMKPRTRKIDEFPSEVPPLEVTYKPGLNASAEKKDPVVVEKDPVVVKKQPEAPVNKVAAPAVKKQPVVEVPVNKSPATAVKPKTPKIESFPTSLPPLETYSPRSTVAGNSVAQDRVTIDFVNTDIVQILKSLALQAGVNIVTSPDVKSSLTVKLTNVSIDEALRFVTSLAGMSYARVGSAFVVAAPDKIEQIRRQILGIPDPEAPRTEAYVTRSYGVRGGLAADLVKSVGGDKGPLGKTTLKSTPDNSMSRQTIVLNGPQSEVNEILETLMMLDSADEATGTFQIYDVKFLDPRSAREQVLTAVPGIRVLLAPAPAGNPALFKSEETLNQGRQTTQAGDGGAGTTGGATGGGAGAAGGGAGQTVQAEASDTAQLSGLSLPYRSFEPIAHPMRLILRGTPQQIAAATSFLGQTDTAPKQVALELRAMELSKEEALRVGLDWSILQGSGLVRLLRINQGLQGADAQGSISSVFKGGSVVGALDQLGDSRHLIARPNVLALDGRETEVFVGDVIRYIKSIQSTQNGVTVTTDEVRVGVRLAVLARAGADGNISLDLRPTLSFLRQFTQVPGGGQLPQTSERTTQSTAVIKSGETIALGGLIQDFDRKTVGGIPILKDLPIVGALFRRTDNSKVRTEVVFFLTARIVDDTTRQDAARPTGGAIPPKSEVKN